jgi:octaprenyl-diphosphate synthase
VSTDKVLIERMRLFGETVGIAFQIRDDLFDYGTDTGIGKPTGIDIKEKKMTLPLIYALTKGTKEQRKVIMNTMKNHNTDPKRVASVIEMVRDLGGLEYATARMNEYRQRAQQMLMEYPDNDARRSLSGLVDFVIDRAK